MSWSGFFKSIGTGLKVVWPVAVAAAKAGVIRGDAGRVLNGTERSRLLSSIETEARRQRYREEQMRGR